MSNTEIQICYEEGFSKHGPGAVVVLCPGVWHFETVALLRNLYQNRQGLTWMNTAKH